MDDAINNKENNRENNKNDMESVKNGEIMNNKPPTILVTPNDTFITKRPKIYKQFLRLIKRKKALTGIVMADILGVSRQTIGKWLDTPQARDIIAENIDYHFNKISNSNDWKAHAYIIDTVKGKDNTTNIQVNTLDGLTIIRP